MQENSSAKIAAIFSGPQHVNDVIGAANHPENYPIFIMSF